MRGDFSLIGSPFSLGKEICHSNSAMAETMREGFVRSAQGFMPIWGPKVTQLAGVTLEPLKPQCMTMSIPIRCPPHPWARPEPSQSVRNVHTEQGD